MARRRDRFRIRLQAEVAWACMARHGLSQNQLAQVLGVTSGYVSLLINGMRSPSAKLRRDLLEALPSATFDQLFTMERRQPDGEYLPVDERTVSNEQIVGKPGRYNSKEASTW